MFKTPWFDKALIRSDEGFSLRWGRDWATYNENERKLTFTIDVGGQGASIFVRRREVYQVVVMDHQRRQIVLFAHALELRDAGGARDGGFPLARARRKDLERVRTHLGRPDCGIFKRF